MRYLQGTESFGILFRTNDGARKLIAYSDADGAWAVVYRKSTSRLIGLLERSPVCLLSNERSSTAMFTTGAGYMAMRECAEEIRRLRNMLGEFQVMLTGRTALYEGEPWIGLLNGAELNMSNRDITSCENWGRKAQLKKCILEGRR